MTAVVDTEGIHGPAVPKISAADMKDRLLTLSEAREKLATSEPILSIPFDVGGDIKFVIADGWREASEGQPGTARVNATILLGPEGGRQEYRLSKDALLEATSIVGLPKGYVERCPSQFIEGQLNYWFSTGGMRTSEYQTLVTGSDEHQLASAVVKGTVKPFSNLELVDQAVAGIQDKYGSNDLLVDYKFQHDLRRTRMSIIIPEYVRAMERTGTENDTWSVGLNISNSLIGLEKTQFSGYLFRWWCTNGAIDTKASSSSWNRKQGQGDEVMEWARTTVDEVLGGLEHSLDAVQSLVDVPLEGAVAEVLREIFTDYKVPVAERERVIANMVEESNLNMYSVMQAVTQVANRAEIDPGHMRSLMKIGGDLPHTISDRCDNCHRVMHN